MCISEAFIPYALQSRAVVGANSLLHLWQHTHLDLYLLCRAAAGKDGAKGHRKQGAKRIWSNLTAQDHAWYLAKQGEPS